jgi:hypothetical protein
VYVYFLVSETRGDQATVLDTGERCDDISVDTMLIQWTGRPKECSEICSGRCWGFLLHCDMWQFDTEGSCLHVFALFRWSVLRRYCGRK